MSTDFGKRLRSARSLAGLTQVQLARQAGMGQSTIAELETLGNGTSRTATLASICRVSALWLESGDGPMTADAATLLSQLPGGMRRYPVLSFSQAVARIEGADETESLGVEVATCDVSPEAFFLQLEDNSMSPEFREGDRVLIDPALRPQPGDCVVAKSGAQQLLFRKYRVRGVGGAGEDVFELVPLNDDHPV
ncbi:LexA family transcriptional regulator, partial [Delftia tsuruhatensis]